MFSSRKSGIHCLNLIRILITLECREFGNTFQDLYTYLTIYIIFCSDHKN